MKRNVIIRFAVSIATSAVAIIGLSAAATSSTAASTVSAITQVTDHPVSSEALHANYGDWAYDNFTRTATVHLVGPTADSNCSPTATTCYSWTGKLKDAGTFTTVVGQADPGQVIGPSTQEQALTGSLKGGTSGIAFYATSNDAEASRVPTMISGPVSGEQTTINWVEQFFPAGTAFNSSGNSGAPDLGSWSWTYTLAFGSNTQCPNLAFRFVDSAAGSGGSVPYDGSIQTPLSSPPAPCE